MGLDLTLSNRCRSVLLHCSEFDSDLSLRALFITDELAPFRDGLPEAKNKGDRTDLVLAYLVDKRLSDGRFVLPLFLLRLRSDYHPSNRLYFELDALAQEVLKALNKTISVSPPKEGIPKEPRQTKRVRQPQIIKVTNIIGDGNVIGNGSSSHVGEKDARSNIVVSDDAFDSVQRVYKVFIASPSDVLPERQTVYAVVEKINQTLRIMKRNCFLQVYDWKRSVHPDYGPPQDVISKQKIGRAHV